MPSPNLDFLKARAAQCRDEAEAAELAHVRERCERSEAAWNEMIAREERIIRDREARHRRKAEAGEAADMLRHRATECRDLSARSRTEAARQAFGLLAEQLDEQARQLDPPKPG